MAGDISDMMDFSSIADDSAIARQDFVAQDTANQISNMMQYQPATTDFTSSSSDFGTSGSSTYDFTSGATATNANTQDFGDFSPRSDSTTTTSNVNTGGKTDSTFNLGSLSKALGKLGNSQKNTTTNAKITPIPTPSPSGTANNTLDTPILDDLLKKYRGRNLPNY